ncbi:phage transcriptional regulator, AlpA [Novosphingobium aromaticivorans DSM 12444]|mgnify:CR=1 FL=1|uniref:Phage transcriptional regulator, AlpA n=1 Tax=Novosphingobium aromaticivorans (strain ATCC 700278 / DSM 12444 / CCUG 56034 / CIP 105152 / NBRC 16084 / F199) TaxID=279238 RepID=Q2G6D1_NOVAD|nr:AlpA family transcriptional regulator [Novosphingobium aromaticivorans]ABD26592.1 phage transcriptional regulator, AlpA [Novosphingobium aromaticivorans DSM 12444]SCY75098.1 transcriptional regulator, AlpA family [Novosphingobium aromaticivorans]
MTAAPSNEATSPHSNEAAPLPARLLRLPDVMARVGMKRSAIYQRMSEGRFPKSRSLGPKCAVWVEAEIEEWIEQVANSTHS